MNKIPVRQTIRFAYAFTFGELGTIIGLIWLPMVIAAVLSFIPYTGLLPTVTPDANPAVAGMISLLNIVLFLAGLVLGCIYYVAVARQALGLRKGSVSIYFAFGKAELRLLGALMLLAALMVVFVIIYIAAVTLAGIAVGMTGNKGVALAAGFLVALAGAGGLIYCFVRLGYLLVPVTVAENKISFERTWLLTAGNFWRIVALIVCTSLPVELVLGAAMFAVSGREMFDFFGHVAALPQAQLVQQLPQLLLQEEQITVRHMPALLGAAFLIAPFSLGLSLGAASAAYRALSGGVPQPAPAESPFRPA